MFIYLNVWGCYFLPNGLTSTYILKLLSRLVSLHPSCLYIFPSTLIVFPALISATCVLLTLQSMRFTLALPVCFLTHLHLLFESVLLLAFFVFGCLHLDWYPGSDACHPHELWVFWLQEMHWGLHICTWLWSKPLLVTFLIQAMIVSKKCVFVKKKKKNVFIVIMQA